MKLAARPAHGRSRKRRMWIAGLLAMLVAGVLIPVVARGQGSPPAATAGRVKPTDRGLLGTTMSFNGTVRGGGPYLTLGKSSQNQPMFIPRNSREFWDDYVEELLTAGVDYVAADLRGRLPYTSAVNSNGDPTNLSGLVDAIKRRGAQQRLKIAVLDDTAASLAAMKNKDRHNSYLSTPAFDVGDASGTGEGGYKYFWDYNLRYFFTQVPANMRLNIDKRPVVFEWTLGGRFFTNQGNGNAARMLRYAKQKAKAEFGTYPFWIVDKTWYSADPTIAPLIGGIHDWFWMGDSATVRTFKGFTTGVVVPGYQAGPNKIDPKHGATLRANLQDTVDDAHADITLIEGLTDFGENAALARSRTGSYAQTGYDYPNQRLNIVREFSRNPFPTHLRVEAETADSYSDTTSGNSWPGVYRAGSIDVEKNAGRSGWHVGNVTAGEYLEWRQIPLKGTTTFKVNVATDGPGRKIRFVVDGRPGRTITLPKTGGFTRFQTVSAGRFTMDPYSRHTVRVEFVKGPLNIDSWTN